MVIQDKFKLIREASNILNVPEVILNRFQEAENNPRNIFTFLKQRERSIKAHFTNDKIFRLIENIKEREMIKVVTFDDYILPVSYSPVADAIIINLKPFNVKEISEFSPNNLYALLVYGYAFRKFIKDTKVPDNFAGTVISYFLSLFVKLFGKEYGLLGIYASGIPKLKYMIAVYILCSFFGYPINDKLLRKATTFAPYDFRAERTALLQYNYRDIKEFIKALSETRVFPGIKLYGFTAKVHRSLEISFMPALEDLSRFICILLSADIKGSTIVKSFISSAYNQSAYDQTLVIAKRAFK